MKRTKQALLLFVPCLLAVCVSAAAASQRTGAGDKTPATALPAAKEELLGERSPQTAAPKLRDRRDVFPCGLV